MGRSGREFCPFVSETPKMDEDEPIIGEETGTETFDHGRVTAEEPTIDEETGTETFDHERVESMEHPMRWMAMTCRPSYRPIDRHRRRFRKAFYARHGKAIGVILALVVIIAGVVGMYFYGPIKMTIRKDTVALSQQLATENVRHRCR